MTTIAYANGVMASDSAATCSRTGQKVLMGAKIFRINSDLVMGFVGEPDMREAVKFFRDVRCERELPTAQDIFQIFKDDALLVFCKPRKIFYLETDKKVSNIYRCADKYAAMGSGSDVARGFMFWGGDARGAIKAACKHNAFTSGPIKTVMI